MYAHQELFIEVSDGRGPPTRHRIFSSYSESLHTLLRLFTNLVKDEIVLVSEQRVSRKPLVYNDLVYPSGAVPLTINYYYANDSTMTYGSFIQCSNDEEAIWLTDLFSKLRQGDITLMGVKLNEHTKPETQQKNENYSVSVVTRAKDRSIKEKTTHDFNLSAIQAGKLFELLFALHSGRDVISKVHSYPALPVATRVIEDEEEKKPTTKLEDAVACIDIVYTMNLDAFTYNDPHMTEDKKFSIEIPLGPKSREVSTKDNLKFVTFLTLLATESITVTSVKTSVSK